MYTGHDHAYIKSEQPMTVNDRSHMYKPTSNVKRKYLANKTIICKEKLCESPAEVVASL